jgi:hypothetical protein
MRPIGNAAAAALRMLARYFSIARYRQSRFVAFMVPPLNFPRTEALPPVHLFIAFMLAGLIPAVQDA